MKNIHICELGHVTKFIKKHQVTHVLSLLEPGERPWFPPSFDKKNWKLVICDDVFDASAAHAPKREQVEEFLKWANELPEDAVLLVHCQAGISRSTAAALAIIVQNHLNWFKKEFTVNSEDEDVIIFGAIQKLKNIRPQACPNQLITKFADDILEFNGKLHRSAEELANSKILRLIRESQ